MLTYQDEFLPGGVVRGERDCDERWALIAPHLPERGVLLDIGSNLGYYGLRSVVEGPKRSVVSIEADPAIADRQAKIVSEHATDRMLVLTGQLDSEGAQAWAESCDWFDATFLLAIIHWFDDPAAVVAALSSMSGKLIIEVPDPADEGACGQEKLQSWSDPVSWFREVTGRDVHHIGRVARHTSTVPSHLIVVDGPVSRTPRRPYRGGPQHELGRYDLTHDGERTTLTVGDEVVERVEGINLVNLMKAGALRYPSVATLGAMADAELQRQPKHPDPFPHNMLWGAGGITLIDSSPVDALLTAKDAQATLDVHLPRWAEGKTVADESLVREASTFARLRHSSAGQAILGHVPATLKTRVRRLLFGR